MLTATSLVWHCCKSHSRADFPVGFPLKFVCCSKRPWFWSFDQSSQFWSIAESRYIHKWNNLHNPTFTFFQQNRKQTNDSFEAFLMGNQRWHIKGKMLRWLVSYPKSIFRFIRPVHVHLKMDNVDYLKKPSWKKNLLDVFAIHSSSRHEKCCQMFIRLFCLFQCFRNQQWQATPQFLNTISGALLSVCRLNRGGNNQLWHVWNPWRTFCTRLDSRGELC